MAIHMKRIRTLLIFCCTTGLLFGVLPAAAHSGKARFHVIVDTDGAADDLRTISLLLGNRELEVLALTSSEGALHPDTAAYRAAALLRSFYHEGVPVGVGRAVDYPAPEWRTLSEQISWGEATDAPGSFPAATELIARTLENEEERVVFVALGPLTNLADLLDARPDLAGRIERVVWYDDAVPAPSGPNYRTDTLAARKVLASGLKTEIISENPDHPVAVDAVLIDSIAAVGTPYAKRIVATHRTEPVSDMIRQEHLRAWDDLVPVYLFAPELFARRGYGEHADIYTLRDAEAADRARELIVELLRGKKDTESRVLYGFPDAHELYASDVVPIIDRAIERHGPSEWRAGVLTNELHGHLGIYATIGVKMGIRAREYFDIGVDDIAVTSYAGLQPPVSCMNDGLQVGTGASLGHGLITAEATDRPRPEARFRFKDKTIRLRLKPEYARRIREDVKRGVELYGNQTEAYWQYIRALALQYWLDFDRHEIFDLTVEN